MEKSRRVARVEKELREAIASHFVGSMRTELPGIVTVARVHASGDLRSAKVIISIFGSEDEVAESMEVIEAHTPEIQQAINRRIKMKFCPKLKFFLDDWVEHMAKVSQSLKEIQGEEDVDS